jgi:hypothetical protein
MKALLKMGLVFGLIFMALLASCASQPASNSQAALDFEQAEGAEPQPPVLDQQKPGNTGSFDDAVKGKEWRLSEIRTESQILVLDRQKLGSEGFADAFTLNFGDGLVLGRGAPNTFRAPYEQGQNKGLSIGRAAATLMAPLKEPTDFKENEYFAFLENIYRWNTAGENLELYTKTGDGKESVLVFAAD